MRLPFWLLKGRAVLKDEVASRVTVAVEHLPYRASLVSYLREEKLKGRPIVAHEYL